MAGRDKNDTNLYITSVYYIRNTFELLYKQKEIQRKNCGGSN